MSLVEQELLILPEHLSSPPVFSGGRVTRSLVLYVCFVDRCLSFCTFSFGHCVVCSSLINGFWLPVWYLQTLLKQPKTSKILEQQHFSRLSFLGGNKSNILDGLLTFWKIIGVVHKRGVVVLLCCCFGEKILISSILDQHYKD